MSRDLFPEVENIISSSNPYIRRKAALCAMRICRKVPDLQEHFVDKAKVLLNDRNHGVLLCGLTLVTSLCEADEAEGGENGMVDMFRPVVPSMVKVLKSLASAGYTPEHDVNGISDPFLQVKIVQLLRVLARGDSDTSEQINDILAQVATNTDGSKNVGNSILYEAVLTILDIEADSALRVLGVNILGKFLSNKDNNIRYVALNTLVKVVAIEPNAVQRHRNTILDCLRDPDISIRRRALDLSFTLINESNVRVLVRELLAFLEVADIEFKPTMTSQIGIAADRFAPTKRWHIDTMLRVLKLVCLRRIVARLIRAGRKPRQGADLIVVCATDRHHAGAAAVLGAEALRGAEGGHHAGRTHLGRHVGDWRVRRGPAARPGRRGRRGADSTRPRKRAG
jgi:AP-1 complex subunit gamma-1